jgi:ribosomal protein S18 acetylase RimI-like enzyme
MDDAIDLRISINGHDLGQAVLERLYDRVYQIDNLYVDDSLQHLGFATSMVSYLESVAKANDATEVIVPVENTPQAVGFWTSMGYKGNHLSKEPVNIYFKVL